jgi:Reverse transcriptase (RNA-dependent DNA polymerase)
VLAYPQADVECDLFMKIPKGFKIEDHDQTTNALKLKNNLYGQKQAGRVWNKHLHKKTNAAWMDTKQGRRLIVLIR